MKSTYWGTQEQAIASVRNINKGSAILARDKKFPIVAVCYESNKFGSAGFALWKGKEARPSHYYRFKTAEAMRRSLEYYWKQAQQSLEARETRKKEEAAKRATLKASDHYAVGDVLYTCWGYEQTNIDFYEVVEVKARSIVIRELKQNRSEEGFLQGRCQPIRGDYCGEPELKPLDAYGRAAFKFGGFSKWDGTAKHYTAYA